MVPMTFEISSHDMLYWIRSKSYLIFDATIFNNTNPLIRIKIARYYFDDKHRWLEN